MQGANGFGNTFGVVVFKEFIMGKVIAYMLTWTTYGTWLQGDKRGYVKDGEVLGENKKLYHSNKAGLKQRRVKLNSKQKLIVEEAIREKAKKLCQRIFALTVCSNHVHIVLCDTDEPARKIAGVYKKAGTDALRKEGFAGKVWTKGYDKRYCFCEEEIEARIRYVNGHG